MSWSSNPLGVADTPASSALSRRVSPYSSWRAFSASTKPSVKMMSQSPGASVRLADSYFASGWMPRGNPPTSRRSIAPLLRRKTGLLCPALM